MHQLTKIVVLKIDHVYSVGYDPPTMNAIKRIQHILKSAVKTSCLIALSETCNPKTSKTSC